MKTQTRFKHLDWENLGQVEDRWAFSHGFPGAFEDSWTRTVLFDNSNWRRAKDDSFTVEVIDSTGEVRVKEKYFRNEFIADNPYAGHTRISWQMANVQPPLTPGDNTVRALVVPQGMLPNAPTFRTTARLDLFGSTNPFKTIDHPGTCGRGRLRVTWSQMPDEPFYFPVTFVARGGPAATCFDDAGQPRAVRLRRSTRN